MTRTESSVIAILLAVLITFPALWLLATGDFIGSDNFYGIQEDSTVIDFLFNLRELFTGK